MAINVSQSFHRTSANAVDDTLTLTKAEMLAVNDNLMPKYYFTICQDDGKLYLYNKNATPSATTGKFTEFSGGGSSSAGTYATSATLTTIITGTSTIAISSVTGASIGDIVVGETLIYDNAGTLGCVTLVSGNNLTVTTVTAAPGDRRGVRLGAVNAKTDLPATASAAISLGWQSPVDGDYAYVRVDATHDNKLTEWVITATDNSGNLTWGYSHTLNSGDYVVDILNPDGTVITKASDGTVKLPDFGTIKGIKDASGTSLVPSAQGIVTLPADKDTTYSFADTPEGFRATNTVTGNVYFHVDKGVNLDNNVEHLTSRSKAWFVDGDNGDDVNGDGTLDHPFKNIQRVVEELPIRPLDNVPYPAYRYWDSIYINCGATEPYSPVYFDGVVQPVTIYSYDPAKSYITETGSNYIVNNSFTSTLKITSNTYKNPTNESYIYPNCWYQRQSIVYLKIKNVILTQNSITTAMYIGCGSTFEHGDGNAANYDKIAFNFTINATKVGPQTFYKTNPSTGRSELFTTPTNIGCEGLGVHCNSTAYFRGYASNGSRVTINASNWAVACSAESRIGFEPAITIAGGSNTAGNYGGMYASQCSTIYINNSGTSNSSTITTNTITSNGKSQALSASDGAYIRSSNGYVKATIQQTRTDCAAACIQATGAGAICIAHTASGYLNIISKTNAQRCISANNYGVITLGFPTSGTANVTYVTGGTQQCITAAEGGRVHCWGGSGSTLPVLTGKTGYAAYSGGQLTYANIGKFNGTTQRTASSGGRIYTGNQSSIGNY